MARRKGGGDEVVETDEKEGVEFTQSKDIDVFPTFESMELREDLLKGVYSYGFERPSAIQQRAIRPIVMGRDVIAQSQSGTGKTAVFCIGALQARRRARARAEERDTGATAAARPDDEAKTTNHLFYTPTDGGGHLCQDPDGSRRWRERARDVTRRFFRGESADRRRSRFLRARAPRRARRRCKPRRTRRRCSC